MSGRFFRFVEQVRNATSNQGRANDTLRYHQRSFWASHGIIQRIKPGKEKKKEKKREPISIFRNASFSPRSPVLDGQKYALTQPYSLLSRSALVNSNINGSGVTSR